MAAQLPRCGAMDRDSLVEGQIAEDDALAMQDAARYARRVRKRLGLMQFEFPEPIGVPIDTIRNWEQGERSPTGAAQTLSRLLDKLPEPALAVLEHKPAP